MVVKIELKMNRIEREWLDDNKGLDWEEFVQEKIEEAQNYLVEQCGIEEELKFIPKWEGFKFERIMEHPGRGLTGLDLEASKWYDEIMFIRMIEQNQEDIKEIGKEYFINYPMPLEYKLLEMYDDGFSAINPENIREDVAKKAFEICFE